VTKQPLPSHGASLQWTIAYFGGFRRDRMLGRKIFLSKKIRDLRSFWRSAEIFKMGKLSKKILSPPLPPLPKLADNGRHCPSVGPVATKWNCLHNRCHGWKPLAWLYGLTHHPSGRYQRRKFLPHVRDCGIVEMVNEGSRMIQNFNPEKPLKWPSW